MQEFKNNRIIASWLYVGVVMIIVQVLLGGVTRLTGSGLSITEWKPIMGALPPLNEAEWIIAFDKYKQIGQYKFINADFTLSNFKFIFFWEWLHRNWARVIGLVFFIPFVVFIIKGMIPKKYISHFVIIFFIGALQGLVGWIMVASGLNDDMLFVNYFKLATHFLTALLALCVVYWYALFFADNSKEILLDKFDLNTINNNKPTIFYPINYKMYIGTLLALLIVQLGYGAFMAGLKAAAAAPTWPSINGAFAPDGMRGKSFYSHPINVHFVHRNLAYIITILVLLFTISAATIKNNTTWTKAIKWPMIFVVLQVILGISTVLLANHPARNAMGPFEWSAQFHQLIALFLLLSLVKLFYLVSHPNKST